MTDKFDFSLHSMPDGPQLSKFSVVAITLLVTFVLSFWVMLRSVPPDGLAVRQIFLGPNKGLQNVTMGPGLYRQIPGYEQLHLFPRDVQLLELNDSSMSSSNGVSRAPSIHIQTSDGSQVKVDVTVAYRIVDPYLLLTTVGAGNLYETALVAPRADVYLRQALGRLNAEQFYNGFVRRAASQEAFEALSEDLEANGIQVWNVMVRQFTYDSGYQAVIEERKIQDQTRYLELAQETAAIQEAEKRRVEAEGNARIGVERERGLAEIRRIAAEADLYYRTVVAEGNLLVALAEAEGARLEQEALRVDGADNIVGLEMARVLEGTEVIIVPTDGAGGINPLDLDSIVGGW
jgi:regulator of protease activity HflC (stomatin/prohibitin superfamily)